jgi:hypothetical protein
LLQTNKSQEELILPFTRHKRERARDRRKKERARKRVRERPMEVLVKELCQYSQNQAERHKIQISDQ